MLPIWIILNSLPNSRILDQSKLKRFADDNSNVVLIMVYVLDRKKNIVKKGENAGNQHFLLFSLCFQLCFLRPLTLSKTSPCFYMSSVEVFLKISLEKEKLLVMSNFSFSHSNFYLSKKLSAILINLQLLSANSQFGRV